MYETSGVYVYSVKLFLWEFKKYLGLLREQAPLSKVKRSLLNSQMVSLARKSIYLKRKSLLSCVIEFLCISKS